MNTSTTPQKYLQKIDSLSDSQVKILHTSLFSLYPSLPSWNSPHSLGHNETQTQFNTMMWQSPPHFAYYYYPNPFPNPSPYPIALPLHMPMGVPFSHGLGFSPQWCGSPIDMLNQIRMTIQLMCSYASQPVEGILDELFEFHHNSIDSNLNPIPIPTPPAIPNPSPALIPVLTPISIPNVSPEILTKSDDFSTKEVKREVPKEEFVEKELKLNVNFLGLVLSWHIDVITGPSLLPSNLPEIPMVFTSSKNWFKTFRPFILEETRCMIDAAIEAMETETLEPTRRLKPFIKLGNNPHQPAARFHRCPPSATMECEISFEIKDSDELDYIIKKYFGLGIMIHNYNPKRTVKENMKSNKHFLINIGFPVRGPRFPNSNPSFDAVVMKSQLVEDLGRESDHKWELIFVDVPMFSLQRVYDCLGYKAPLPFMKSLLCGEVTEEEEPEVSPKSIGNLEAAEVLLSSLNECQGRAIKQVLSVGIPGIPRIQLIKGPPGTGKTRTIIQLLKSLVASNLRVHATAPTNIAVTELAKRYLLNCSPKKVVIVGDTKRLGLTPNDILWKAHLETKAELIENAVYDFLCDREFFSRFRYQPPSEDDHENYKYLQKIMKQLQHSLSVIELSAPSILYTKRCELDGEMWENISKAAFDDFASWLHNSDQDQDLSNSFCDLYHTLRQSLLGIVINTDARNNLKREILRESEVIFSTVNVGARNIFNNMDIDVVIIDEATQVLEGDTCTIFRPNLKCLVLVGDEKQLPAVVQSRDCQRLNYGLSLFDRLVKLRYPFTLLNIQYRMHPLISQWPSKQFYDDELQNDISVSTRHLPWSNYVRPLEIYDVQSGNEELEGLSLYNKRQVDVVRDILSKLRREIRKHHDDSQVVSIGIISPYKQQVTLLKDLEKKTDHWTIKVGTVDGFQGQECDIVILTTVRSNNLNTIGFLQDLRRLNVAITRSRHSLILVGDTETLRTNTVWAQYLDHVYLNRGRIRIEIDSGVETSKLTEEDPVEETLWSVNYQSEFNTSLALYPIQFRNRVKKAISDLALGKWPRNLRYQSARSDAIDEIYKELISVQGIAKVKLVWSIDVNHSNLKQYIKIWDLVDLDRCSKVIFRIQNDLKKYGDDYLNRCKSPSLPDQNGIYSPKSWQKDEVIRWYKNLNAREQERERESMNSLSECEIEDDGSSAPSNSSVDSLNRNNTDNSTVVSQRHQKGEKQTQKEKQKQKQKQRGGRKWK